MRNFYNMSLELASKYWQRKTSDSAFASEVCEKSEPYFLAMLCFYLQNKTSLARKPFLVTKQTFQKELGKQTVLTKKSVLVRKTQEESPLKQLLNRIIHGATHSKAQEYYFGAPTKLALDTFMAGTIFEQSQPKRPFLNDTQRIISRLTEMAQQTNYPPKYDAYIAVLGELSSGILPIELLERYLYELDTTIKVDSKTMKENSDNYLRYVLKMEPT